MHGQNVAFGHEPIHDREHRLLDLARIGGAADQDFLSLEVDDDEDLGARAVLIRRGAEAGRRDDRVLRQVFSQGVAVSRPHEHVAGEEALPSLRRDDPEGHAEAWVGAHEAVLYEQVAPLKVGGEAPAQLLVARLRERLIVGTPPHFVIGLRAAHHVLVGRGPAGELSGADDDRPAVREDRLAAEDGLLGQSRAREVPENAARVTDTGKLQAMAALGETEMFCC